jgi:hypothetical protein
MTKRGNTKCPEDYLGEVHQGGKWFKREQYAILDHIFNAKRCESDVINTRGLAFRLTDCRGAHFVILSHS